jgi:hypothetical protein
MFTTEQQIVGFMYKMNEPRGLAKILKRVLCTREYYRHSRSNVRGDDDVDGVRSKNVQQNIYNRIIIRIKSS